MSNISFVYFDVGGVAIKDFSDTNKWEQMFRDLGIPQSKCPAADKYISSFSQQICTGKINIDDLLPNLRRSYGATVSDNFSILEYLVNHFERNEGVWEVVHHLSEKNVKLGLLTDQYPNMLDLINSHKMLPPVNWDVIIDSTLVGYQKPMPEIYSIAQEKAGVPANEILFIDNRQKNLDGAKKAGWQTYLYNSSDYEQSNQELEDFINHSL